MSRTWLITGGSQGLEARLTQARKWADVSRSTDYPAA